MIYSNNFEISFLAFCLLVYFDLNNEHHVLEKFIKIIFEANFNSNIDLSILSLFCTGLFLAFNSNSMSHFNLQICFGNKMNFVGIKIWLNKFLYHKKEKNTHFWIKHKHDFFSFFFFSTFILTLLSLVIKIHCIFSFKCSSSSFQLYLCKTI